MLFFRKLAQISWGAGGGKDNEFRSFWPYGEDVKEGKSWGTKEEAEALQRAIEKAHGIKLGYG